MITEQEIKFVYEGEDGVPLSFIINEENLYDIALSKNNSLLFLNASEFIDNSYKYPEHNGIVIGILNKSGDTVEEFFTSEYFGSILLSNPLIVNYLCHAYGRYAESLKSKFIDYDFVIYNRSDLNPFSEKWYSEKYIPRNESIKCSDTEGYCNCGWNKNG